MIRNFLFLCIGLLLTCKLTNAQQHQTSIKQVAIEMGNALVKKDGDHSHRIRVAPPLVPLPPAIWCSAAAGQPVAAAVPAVQAGAEAAG